MERAIEFRNRACNFIRLFVVFIALQQLLPMPRAQQVLDLCTEAALRSYVEIGGSYMLQCSSTLFTLNITSPLIVERDLSLMSTQEVLLDGKSLTRLFIVKPGVRLTLDRVLLFSGRSSPTNENNGGVSDTAGGAIYNDRGFVTVRNSRFEANSAVGVTGIAAEVGTGDDGEEGGDAAGAAIYSNGGEITISNTVFVSNSVTAGSGGAGSNGESAFFSENGGDGGNGGSSSGAAIYSNGGRVFVQDSVFTNNTAVGAVAGAGGIPTGFLGFTGEPGEAGDGVGAAIGGQDADIIISGSTFVANNVTGANGLAGIGGLRSSDEEEGKNGGEGAGGAVYSTGKLSVTNCTFFGNVAKGGNGGAGGAGSGSGFGTAGGPGGDGGTGSGGAIESAGPATIVNCTFSDNVVTGGTGGVGGAGVGVGETGRSGSSGEAIGGAINGSAAQIILANCILAHSTSLLSGNISDRGGNLTTDRSSLITSPASFRLANPYLLPLAANGGPTPTMAFRTNSLALDHGIVDYCPPIDQRGTNRITCDIGAYEIYTIDTNLPAIPGEILNNGLTITLTTNGLVNLSWPAGYTNLFLQFTTNLAITNWSTLVTNLPSATNNSSYILSVNATNTSRASAFFRLIGITNLAMTNLLFP